MRHLKLLFATSSRAIGSNSIQARMASSGCGDARKNILTESWSTVSREYERVLVPRFAPWTRDALGALQKANRDSGGNASQSALVLCCGPGQELLPIAKLLGPNSRVLGTDLAPGMIETATIHIKDECRKSINLAYTSCISAEVADAQRPPPGPYDVVFSAFGLQQLPDPIAAVREWIGVLKPGGVCVTLMGKETRANIRLFLWGDLVKRRLGKEGTEEPWDDGLQAAVVAAGGVVLDDRFISHEICWKDSREMFDGMSRAGPWHALRLRRGDAFVDELGKELQSLYPAGQQRHEFTARLIVARRDEGQNSS